MYNAYVSAHGTVGLHDFQAFWNSIDIWIQVAAYLLILFGAFTIYVSWAVATSPNTVRLLIYIFSLSLGLLCFLMIDSINMFTETVPESARRIQEWPIRLSYALALISLLILVLLILTNVKRGRLFYLILGSILLFVTIIQTPATG